MKKLKLIQTNENIQAVQDLFVGVFCIGGDVKRKREKEGSGIDIIKWRSLHTVEESHECWL